MPVHFKLFFVLLHQIDKKTADLFIALLNFMDQINSRLVSSA